MAKGLLFPQLKITKMALFSIKNNYYICGNREGVLKKTALRRTY